MKLKILPVFFLVAISQGLAAQTTDTLLTVNTVSKSPPRKTFTDFIAKISLRQSFQGKLEKDEAAFFNIVNPQDKPNSYNLSAALGINIFPEYKRSTLRPFGEWQKNSLSDKAQNVILGGLDFQSLLWDPAAPGKTRTWTPYIISKANYKKDIIKKTEGLQASVYFTPVFNGKGGKFYPLPDAVNSSWFLQFYYNLYAGIEYENRAHAVNSIQEGAVIRGYGRVTASIYVFSKLLNNHLEFIPDYTYRSSISNHSGAEKNTNSLWKWNLNFVILTKEKSGIADFKFGMDYVNGIDPTKGFDKQKVITYSFKVKI